MSLQASTWQTVGPYFRIGMQRLFQLDVAGENVAGRRVRVVGRVIDGEGMPVPDGVIEIWQANSHGKYQHPADTQDKPIEEGFRGFGRIPTDQEGFFRFTTIVPGSVPGPNGVAQAPHLVVGLLMRGVLRGLVTRAYFPGEALNASDPILQMIDAHRRSTLIMRESGEPNVLLWEIRLQGTNETVFLDF